ncbi:unnamed protein product [Musa textilis]
MEEETSEVYKSEIEYEGNGEKPATVVLLLVSSTKKTTVSSYLLFFSVAFPLFNFLVSLSTPLYHPTMAALVPDSTNNSSSSNKPDVDGLSCSSAISGGASDNTTYVRAEPDNFRALVQRLTGASAATDNYSFAGFPQKHRRWRPRSGSFKIEGGPPPSSRSTSTLRSTPQVLLVIIGNAITTALVAQEVGAKDTRQGCSRLRYRPWILSCLSLPPVLPPRLLQVLQFYWLRKRKRRE